MNKTHPGLHFMLQNIARKTLSRPLHRFHVKFMCTCVSIWRHHRGNRRYVMNEPGGAARSEGWREEDRQADVNERVDKNMLVQQRGATHMHEGRRAPAGSNGRITARDVQSAIFKVQDLKMTQGAGASSVWFLQPLPTPFKHPQHPTCQLLSRHVDAECR